MSASRAVRAPDISRIALVDENGCDTFRSLFLIAKPIPKIACRLVRKIERCRANMYLLPISLIAKRKTANAGGDIPSDRHLSTAMMGRRSLSKSALSCILELRIRGLSYFKTWSSL